MYVLVEPSKAVRFTGLEGYLVYTRTGTALVGFPSSVSLGSNVVLPINTQLLTAIAGRLPRTGAPVLAQHN